MKTKDEKKTEKNKVILKYSSTTMLIEVWIEIVIFQVIYDLDELLAKEEEEETAKDTKKEAVKA